MSDSIDTLEAVAPQYVSEPEKAKEIFLEMAAQQMNPQAWGQLYEQGAAYLAAHLLTVRDRGEQAAQHGGAAGAPTDVSEGDQSISYSGGGENASTLNEEALSTTQYGERFLQLRGQLAAGSGFVAD